MSLSLLIYPQKQVLFILKVKVLLKNQIHSNPLLIRFNDSNRTRRLGGYIVTVLSRYYHGIHRHWYSLFRVTISRYGTSISWYFLYRVTLSGHLTFTVIVLTKFCWSTADLLNLSDNAVCMVQKLTSWQISSLSYLLFRPFGVSVYLNWRLKVSSIRF